MVRDGSAKPITQEQTEYSEAIERKSFGRFFAWSSVPLWGIPRDHRNGVLPANRLPSLAG